VLARLLSLGATYQSPMLRCCRYELLLVDELSTDGTLERLSEHRIAFEQPEAVLGVTHNWNLAWRRFKAGRHANFFISNNDVLIPDGVLDKLALALDPEGECETE
jgi:GT2 family glycosyltransferase